MTQPRLKTRLIFMVLLLAITTTSGCSRESGQTETAEAGTTAGETDGLPAADDSQAGLPSTPAVSDPPPETVAAPAPILFEFPDTGFTDADGHRVGRRDLHGHLVLLQIPGGSSEPSSLFRESLTALRERPEARYTIGLTITSASTSSRQPIPDTEQWVPDAALPDNWGTDDEGDTILLLDPVGRTRGRFTASDDVAAVTELADQIWQEQVPFLKESLLSTWMDARRTAQLESADQIPVPHDFAFSDVRRQSGIRFLHQIVDDAAINYKGVHYDHGTGVTIADIDGDDLLDIYFVNQLGPNQMYRNAGNGTFTDITGKSGTAVGDRVCVAASFADIDNDGDPDLYVTSVRRGNLLFINNGSGEFEDITAASGLGYQGHSSGAIFFDYDRDGLLDLFLCNVGQYTTTETGRGDYYVGFTDAFSGHLKPERSESSRLYRNLGENRFEDVTDAMGLTENSWTGDAAACDLNNDGWTDLYVLDMQGNDEYFENQQGEGFLKKSRDVFPKTPWGAMGVAVTDFDNDEDLDIYVTDMHSDMSRDILADIRSEASMNTFYLEEKDKATMKLPESLLKSEGASIYGNAFFRNDGSGGFEEVSAATNAENYWPWGLSTGDLNADGYEDAFVTSSMNYPFRYGVNSLMLNDGTQFHDAEFVVGAEPRPHGRTAQPWMQINCEEQNSELMQKVIGDRTGEITVWGALGSRASVLFDMDNDGDVDIITNEFNDVPLVLQSDLAQRHDVRYVTIRLTGTRSNRDALGALVTVVTANGRRLRSYDGKVGYLSQGLPELYVGLGEETEVLSLIVRWPGGDREEFTGPWKSGSTISLTEGSAGN